MFTYSNPYSPVSVQLINYTPSEENGQVRVNSINSGREVIVPMNFIEEMTVKHCLEP